MPANVSSSEEAAEENSVIGDFQSKYNSLNGDEKKRFEELAVFPVDVAVPFATLKKLWEKIDSTADADALCARLQELSLLNSNSSFVRLDKLIQQHLILRDNENQRLQSIHQQLLYAHQPPSRKWSDLPESEPYLWDHLVFHLKEAERREDIRAIIGDWKYLAKKTRLRGVAAIESDLDEVEKIDESDRKLRTARLMYKNFGDLFDKWAKRSSIMAKQFVELQSLNEVNAMLEDLAQNSGKQCLTLKLELPSSSSNVRGCRFSHDGKQVVSTTDEGPLMVWEAKSGQLLYRLQRSAPYDEQLGKRRLDIDGHEAEVTSCDFNPESNLIASTSTDCTLKIWHVERRKPIRARLKHEEPVNCCCFSPDGNLVVSASEDQTLKIWDVNYDMLPRTFNDSDQVTSCTFGNDGKWIISASSTGAIKIRDVVSGEILHTPPGHSVAVNSCSFSDKSRKLVSASDDHTLKVWDVDGSFEEPLHTLADHSEAVKGCCFSMDGELIVSASSDQTVKVWDVATGHCCATFYADGPMYCCAMHGDMIVAGGVRGVYFLRLLG